MTRSGVADESEYAGGDASEDQTSGDFAGLGPGDVIPAGQVYDWYSSARELHDAGKPDAAVELLLWAAAAEPDARSIREALARAQFDAHLYADSAVNFAAIVAADPADHYAQFGLGLASSRAGDLDLAVTHLALAVALRPDLAHYEKALRATRFAILRRDQPFTPPDPDGDNDNDEGSGA